MVIIGFAFILGLFVYILQRNEDKEFFSPKPCHICWTRHEYRVVHWNGHHYVHENGGEVICQIDREIAATMKRAPAAHFGVPQTPELLMAGENALVYAEQREARIDQMVKEMVTQ